MSGKFFVKTISLHNDKPVIFWDTCALLDILRLPERKLFKHLKPYLLLRDAIVAGDVLSFTSSLVIHELNDHRIHINNILRSEQNRFNEYSKYGLLLKNNADQTRIQSILDEIEFETLLNSVLNDIVDNTIEVREQNLYMKFADHRARFKIAPIETLRKAGIVPDWMARDCDLHGMYEGIFND